MFLLEISNYNGWKHTKQMIDYKAGAVTNPSPSPHPHTQTYTLQASHPKMIAMTSISDQNPSWDWNVQRYIIILRLKLNSVALLSSWIDEFTF